jgi:tRNA (guanine-N7-)-methyltransferase
VLRAQSPPDGPLHRPVRSFVVRAGRMGSGQVRALAELGPRFVLPFATLQGLARQLRPPGAAVLEIGFGMGDATAAVAAAQPHRLHRHRGASARRRRAAQAHRRAGVTTCASCSTTRCEVLEQMVAPATLAGVHVWFPDPWHKKKHHKRRLIQPAFVATAGCSTWRRAATCTAPPTGSPMPSRCCRCCRPNRAAEHRAGYAPRPDWRPLTKFENRGLKLGHGVWDLVFRRRAQRGIIKPPRSPSRPRR